MLRRWAEQGRVRPDDYLVNLDLDLCVQARDVEELNTLFRKMRARCLWKVSRGLVCAALVLAFVEPLAGAAVLAAAFATMILGSSAGRRSHLYSFGRLHAAARHPRADCGMDLARPA